MIQSVIRSLDTNMDINTPERRKKTRRGKRKTKGKIATQNEQETSRINSSIDTPCKRLDSHPYKKSKRMIRPRYSPKAPCNYTQFIIDDHVVSSGLYTDFSKDHSGEVIPTEGDKIRDSLVYSDQDLSYESLEDEDTDAFLMNDFELAFRTQREEELMTFTKVDLVHGIYQMETHLHNLDDQINANTAQKDPEPSELAIPDLLAKLDELKKLNMCIKSENEYLKQCNNIQCTV